MAPAATRDKDIIETRSYKSSKAEWQKKKMLIELDEEEFIAFPWKVPGALLMDISNIMVEGEGSQSMWDVFEAALPTEGDYPRFREYVRKNPVDAETLTQILADIAELATGRPTEPSSS